MYTLKQARFVADFWRADQRAQQTIVRRGARSPASDHINVGDLERFVSVAAGSFLALIGLGRRDLAGLAIAGVGGAMLYRGATGHCHTYSALGIDTAGEAAKERVHRSLTVVHSINVRRPPEELYAYWRKLENLPSIMSHLKSVRVLDKCRSHWTATAPAIAGGTVEWEAEIVDDAPNQRIAWQSLPGADVDHQGSVQFVRLPGERGTAVRVALEYQPPGGPLGKWVAKLFGEAPDQQIRDDLRRFKRIMEVGEALTIEGQPRGTCIGIGRRVRA
jgi:uncharacterized membrane protein